MGDSQSRFMNRVEIEANFIRRRVNKFWSVRNSRHVHILAEKHLYVSVRKEQSFVEPNNDKQGKLVALIKEGKKNAPTRPDAYTQKWCVRFACALVAYLWAVP